jgi:hypothetical protein
MPHNLKSFCLVTVFSLIPEEAEAIAESVRAFGADCRVACTAAQLREVLIENGCNGLLYSIPSTIRIDAAGKALLRTLEQVYPVARAKWKDSDRSLSVMGTHGPVVRTLPDFLAACAAFPARRIRRYERSDKTLNVLLFSDTGMEDAEQTFSLNLSIGGARLHSSLEWHVGDTLYLSFLELPWQDPVRAEVRHVIPWGVPYHARSIGVQFDGMTPEHADNLSFLLFGKKA